ncbi:protein of unknown function [Candidatus Methylomirabilis oxygeniifera]|uniref:Uncharacterized protein n=1 Tax=Methylomirabilis oxygeniifera TaxID=671143 RepID=D5MIY5_METO1|nr:protein of unknown function [Candidatus Methylomirabilis oxyfera]
MHLHRKLSRSSNLQALPESLHFDCKLMALESRRSALMRPMTWIERLSKGLPDGRSGFGRLTRGLRFADQVRAPPTR